MKKFKSIATAVCTGALLSIGLVQSVHSQQGVTASSIRIGGVMDLQGRSRGLGLGMKRGIEAALKGQRVQGRNIEFITADDSYTPAKTAEAVGEMLKQDIFAMIGNVGTPTAAVSLPILAESKVPAIGFFTGAGILRPGQGDIVNFRASYVQETAAVIDSAIRAGVQPAEICAYVQNDGYGMAGVQGIKQALINKPGIEEEIAALDEILNQSGADPDRNGIGPVGVYKRNTFVSRDGFQSLLDWEEATGASCRLVVTVGTYGAIARFAGYSRYKGKNWLVSAVSFTGANNFAAALRDQSISDGVLMTQVVPDLNSSLPIVAEARSRLGDDFGYVTLEGYIVGKMWLHYANDVQGALTRQNFLNTVRGSTVDLDGVRLDFRNDNQASDLVTLTSLNNSGWDNVSSRTWSQLLDGR